MFQYTCGKPRATAKAGQNEDASLHAFHAISTYVRSGFAPILSVSSPETQGGPRPDKLNHAVVIVGTSRIHSPTQAPKHLIVNDPSASPFETWDQGQFRENSITLSHRASFYCVLPGEVTMPLTRATTTRPTKEATRPTAAVCFGVLQLARLIQIPWRSSGADLRPPELSDFLLVRLTLHASKNAATSAVFPDCLSRLVTVPPSLIEYWESSGRIKALAGRWCWIQVCTNGTSAVSRLTLWDAQSSPVLEHEAAELLAGNDQAVRMAIQQFVLGVVDLENGSWTPNPILPEILPTTPFPASALRSTRQKRQGSTRRIRPHPPPP